MGDWTTQLDYGGQVDVKISLMSGFLN